MATFSGAPFPETSPASLARTGLFLCGGGGKTPSFCHKRAFFGLKPGARCDTITEKRMILPAAGGKQEDKSMSEGKWQRIRFMPGSPLGAEASE